MMMMKDDDAIEDDNALDNLFPLFPWHVIPLQHYSHECRAVH